VLFFFVYNKALNFKEIRMMLHPATAHFAMVLPVVASVFGLVYLARRGEGMSKLSSILTVVAALAMAVVWYTGSQAGPAIYNYLSEGGQHELIEHKTLGLYLAIAFGVIAVLKIAGCRLKKFGLEALSIILLLLGTAVVFKQGKDGGELVYQYGAPFKSYIIEDSLKEAVTSADEAEDDAEKVEIYEDAIDDINGHIEEINEFYSVEAEAQEDEE
jgi:uncharacterized membrane protein